MEAILGNMRSTITTRAIALVVRAIGQPQEYEPQQFLPCREFPDRGPRPGVRPVRRPQRPVPPHHLKAVPTVPGTTGVPRDVLAVLWVRRRRRRLLVPRRPGEQGRVPHKDGGQAQQHDEMNPEGFPPYCIDYKNIVQGFYGFTDFVSDRHLRILIGNHFTPDTDLEIRSR